MYDIYLYFCSENVKKENTHLKHLDFLLITQIKCFYFDTGSDVLGACDRLLFNNILSFTCYNVSILMVFFYVDQLECRNASRLFYSQIAKTFNPIC